MNNKKAQSNLQSFLSVGVPLALVIGGLIFLIIGLSAEPYNWGFLITGIAVGGLGVYLYYDARNL